MKKIIIWVLSNGLLAVALYLGFIKHAIEAERIAYFAAWIAIVCCLLQIPETSQALMKKAGRSVPVWIDIPFDILVALVFIWHAAWITGAFYFLHMIIQQACWSNALKEPMV